MTIDADRLGRLIDQATTGPFDTLSGSLVRALREKEQRAVPIFEARSPLGDPADAPAPTVREGVGRVIFRRGSRAAAQSLAFRREHANVELAAYLLNHAGEIRALVIQARELRRSLAAAKAVALTFPTFRSAIGRIVRLARDQGVTESVTELMSDPAIMALVERASAKEPTNVV